MGQVITFYSYKGGTGRTMALANTACLLARSLPPGEAVLAIDWDLEAPGLHRFFVHEQGTTADSKAGQRGVIDLVLELRALLDNDASFRKDSDAVADLVASVDFSRFIVPTQVPNVSLMTAGVFDDHYENRVVSFNWSSFYETAPAALPALVEFLGTRYSYVLIDSRTGLSDLTGVCTMMLPEKLVTVFTPSRQSLDGLVGVIRRALSYRRQAPDLRPLGVFPLPSRIELAEPDLKESWRLGGAEDLVGYQPMFESLFRELYEIPECTLQNYFDEVQIQHVPRYAYGEQIAVLIEKEADRLSLTRSYEAFVSRLELMTVPWDSPNPPTMEGSVTLQQPSVFISYSHKDEEFLNRLRVHLRPLEQRIELWDDTKMTAAQHWTAEIYRALIRAKAAVLLISADYLASDFVANNELPLLLEKAQSQGTLILPVILKPCRFLRDPRLNKFQAVNDPSRPLAELPLIEQEKIYDRICQSVESFGSSRGSG